MDDGKLQNQYVDCLLAWVILAHISSSSASTDVKRCSGPNNLRRTHRVNSSVVCPWDGIAAEVYLSTSSSLGTHIQSARTS